MQAANKAAEEKAKHEKFLRERRHSIDRIKVELKAKELALASAQEGAA